MKANKWYQLGANQGFSLAQTNLGRQYADGYGVTKDFREANKWLLKAAEQGNDEAQVFLGFHYHLGKGFLQDNVKAHMWFNISSANGNEDSGETRDKVGSLMTASDISEATSMARECMKSEYKKCGY